MTAPAPEEIDVNAVMKVTYVISSITFIGIGCGMLTNPAIGYIVMGVGYSVLFYLGCRE